ncbi:hypothetical protein [Tenacibaculum ovolyticum]|uniref:hypothetical protein n=1 Tax=Tenacibaculum ovolyticum TaxID=104270 RepID=UPI0007ED00D4|nr:hypothetical protein [Tenacibaculum ovolyticum]
MPITRSESGTNLNNWIVNLGDGNYAALDENPVSITDIKTINRTKKSILKTNVLNRRIMAHNITYRKIVDSTAMTDTHVAIYKMKIPYVISTSNVDFNGQTVEGGLFVWDGLATKLDYGLAFQWVINPFDVDYKKIRYWDGSSWLSLGVSLAPDNKYHTIEFHLDIPNSEAYLTIDNITYPQNVFSETPKIGFGTTVDARFQAETISIFPPEVGTIPSQKVNFKDWSWEWSNDIIV